MTIRLATPADLPALGRLGALLMRTHYEFDPQRFMAPARTPPRATRGSSAGSSKTRTW